MDWQAAHTQQARQPPGQLELTGTMSSWKQPVFVEQSRKNENATPEERASGVAAKQIVTYPAFLALLTRNIPYCGVSIVAIDLAGQEAKFDLHSFVSPLT